jgi:hypothetical protein
VYGGGGGGGSDATESLVLSMDTPRDFRAVVAFTIELLRALGSGMGGFVAVTGVCCRGEPSDRGESASSCTVCIEGVNAASLGVSTGAVGPRRPAFD